MYVQNIQGPLRQLKHKTLFWETKYIFQNFVRRVWNRLNFHLEESLLLFFYLNYSNLPFTEIQFWLKLSISKLKINLMIGDIAFCLESMLFSQKILFFSLKYACFIKLKQTAVLMSFLFASKNIEGQCLISSSTDLPNALLSYCFKHFLSILAKFYVFLSVFTKPQQIQGSCAHDIVCEK